MAKFLVQAVLTPEGLKGTLAEGGTKRRAAVEAAVKSFGGKLEAYYYAFGGTDIFGIVDMPDNVSAAAFALMVTAGGGANIHTTVLLTPEEVDKAAGTKGEYRKPGEK